MLLWPMATRLPITIEATAKAAIKGGAYDFIEKPLDLEVFRNLCQRAIQTVALRGQNRLLQEQVDEKFSLEGIIGVSPAMQRGHATGGVFHDHFLANHFNKGKRDPVLDKAVQKASRSICRLTLR